MKSRSIGARSRLLLAVLAAALLAACSGPVTYRYDTDGSRAGYGFPVNNDWDYGQSG